jgi:hypothetical protein
MPSPTRFVIASLAVLAGCGTVKPEAPAAEARARETSAPETPAPVPKTPPKAPPAAPKAPPKAPSPPPVAAARPATPAAAPLDLKTLEQRLKETSAIGVLTKLSLKNQVDDLVARFHAFHQGTHPPTLAELRPSFDLLLMKVLSLLQDHDPALARDINASREAIWGVLTDPAKLARYS